MKTSPKLALTLTALAASLYGSQVFAQTQGDTQSSTSGTTQLQRVEVTGSNIKRIDAETVSPVTVISRDQIERSGQATVAEVLRNLPGRKFGMSGFIADMAYKHDLAPLVWTSGGAGGYVTSDAYERIVGEMIGRLSQAMPVDAVYLDLHGAMCSVDFEDGEGELLRRVRATVGSKIPVVISLDYHTNLTPAMAALTDGMAIYYTYPHVDRHETGSRAARILKTILERGMPTARAIRKPPFLIPPNFQCTLVEPSKTIVERSAAGERGDVARGGLFGPGRTARAIHQFGSGRVRQVREQVGDFFLFQVVQQAGWHRRRLAGRHPAPGRTAGPAGA